jgi:hypothetical protein
MKKNAMIPVVLAATMFALPVAGFAQFSATQSFAGGNPGMDGDPAAMNAPDSSLYADGTRAINEGRWKDAAAIFAKVATEHSEHADGALYWKAYAENKQGQKTVALDTCAGLRRGFPASRWIDECGALEIEIRAVSGKPQQPDAGQSDDVKLLALNLLLQTDEPRALAQIQEILSGNSSEKLKQEAQFILGQHYSDATYPQIVRVSYVEGDVRIARGKQNEHLTGAAWEKAVVDTPLATGFSLVTGDGRAEIEFEDASTLYLAQNSALLFNDLHTTNGAPYTEMALLTGTVAAHILPDEPGKSFLLRTPTDDRFLTPSPGNGFLRISSYADGVAVTPQQDGAAPLPASTDNADAKVHTQFYRAGNRIATPGAYDPDEFAALDKWVSARIALRTEATNRMMQASGLTEPIPGLAEMSGQGHFFDCAPYGTCWEPNGFDDATGGPEAEAPESDQGQASSAPDSPTPSSKSAKKGSATSPPGKPQDLPVEFFPCFPPELRYRLAIDLNKTGTGTNPDPSLSILPYSWAVCHAGTWTHHRHHYVWVVGHKRHHVPPVRWVKSGRMVGFVPLHPYDVKSKPAINRNEVAFTIRERNDVTTVEPVRFDPERPIEQLNAPPREYRHPVLPTLAPAEEPHLVAHKVADPISSKGVQARATGIPILFDHKTGSFAIGHTEMRGGRSTTVFAPIGNRGGNLQSHAGLSGSGGSSHGGSGGGSHSGSGGGGGGGSHGGGGGGSTSSSSTSTASSSAASTTSSSSSSAGSHK